MTDKPETPRGRAVGDVEKALNSQRAYEEQRRTRLGDGTEFLTGPMGRAFSRILGINNMKKVLEKADEYSALTIPTSISTHDQSDLDACEAAALRVQNWAQGTSAATGAAAGWFGPAGLTADLATTLGIAARTVRATAACYGFHDDNDDERAYRLLVLECATASAGEQRSDVIERLRKGAETLNDPVIRAGTDRAMDWIGEKIFDRIARQLGVSFGGRGAGRVVPLVGGLVAATVNASFQADVARAARYAYRMRWLMNRKLLPASAEQNA